MFTNFRFNASSSLTAGSRRIWYTIVGPAIPTWFEDIKQNTFEWQLEPESLLSVLHRLGAISGFVSGV